MTGDVRADRKGEGLVRSPWQGPARRLAPVLGLTAAVFNLNFLLEWALPHRTPIAATVVSDLAASGRAWSWTFRTGDAVSAVALLVLCVLAWVTPVARRTWWRAGTAALAFFASSTLVAAIVPERCTPTSVPPCSPNLVDRGLAYLLHDVISTLGTACGIAAALMFAVALRPGRLARWHLATFLLAGGLGLVFAVAALTGTDSALGWPQRVQIVALSVWFAVVGFSVRDRLPHAARAPARMSP